jgi:hypothetical protein
MEGGYMKWDRTARAVERLTARGQISESRAAKLYHNRGIIGRDSPIDGGIYLGAYQREAIVVDFYSSPMLKSIFERTKLEISTHSFRAELDILNAVFAAVYQVMAYDQNAVEELVREQGVKEDGEISLDVFAGRGIGVCRHMALTCGVIIERLVEEGVMEGSVSIDRKTFREGGHAWCRYKGPDGAIFIIDVAQKYCGKLSSPSVIRKYSRPVEEIAMTPEEAYEHYLEYYETTGMPCRLLVDPV